MALIQQWQLFPNDFRHVVTHTSSIIVMAGFELAFEVHQATFAQVGLGQLGQAAPQYYRIPVGAGVELAAFVAVGFGSGQREFNHGYIAIQYLHLGAFAEVTNQGYFVESSHSRVR